VDNAASVRGVKLGKVNADLNSSPVWDSGCHDNAPFFSPVVTVSQLFYLISFYFPRVGGGGN